MFGLIRLTPTEGGSLVLRDPTVTDSTGRGRFFSTGTTQVRRYDSEAGTNESTSAAANWIRENLPELGGSAPQVSAGEVVINA